MTYQIATRVRNFFSDTTRRISSFSCNNRKIRKSITCSYQLNGTCKNNNGPNVDIIWTLKPITECDEISKSPKINKQNVNEHIYTENIIKKSFTELYTNMNYSISFTLLNDGKNLSYGETHSKTVRLDSK